MSRTLRTWKLNFMTSKAQVWRTGTKKRKAAGKPSTMRYYRKTRN